MTEWTALAAVLSAGLGSLITSIFQGMRMRRDGYNQTRREHMDDIAQWREDLAGKLREVEALLNYWRGVAAGYEYQLLAAGLTPEKPEPPASLLYHRISEGD
ncbi:hypothetical protein [Streptomyces sp. UNOC14_S4]|uniref:hypothetical protein n=1 Tax=Streptomyces sp. UNOC14_S4 TaxID=2872340 RepID=UPI001E604C8F|nr:hypothetical protein [Streptomyces sp. UNOC14_S4]MCC3766008.1 hypothetical protein [Streptomyces sp. UNOC14_S4]